MDKPVIIIKIKDGTLPEATESVNKFLSSVSGVHVMVITEAIVDVVAIVGADVHILDFRK